MQIASIKALCASFKALMDAKENDIFTEWCQKVVEVSKLHLSKSLLTVHEDRQLDVNFDPELTGLLRETRYLIIMKRLELPKEATRLYYRTQFFFESTYNLSLLVQWWVNILFKNNFWVSYICVFDDRYNRIRKYSLPVEFELVRHEIEEVDKLIDFGQNNYDWNSPGKNWSIHFLR